LIGLRNHLIHGYDVVDLDIVWRTTEEDLPRLSETLAGLLALNGREGGGQPPSAGGEWIYLTTRETSVAAARAILPETEWAPDEDEILLW